MRRPYDFACYHCPERHSVWAESLTRAIHTLKRRWKWASRGGASRFWLCSTCDSIARAQELETTEVAA